ncbi:MAG: PspC domain-containing protein [Peptococcaceae bacterium]|jgi:phage shock protein PspC (stress-responsive transcriptional regulator)|nr:PspC domain-containing protein [Peptococcaceae bacterium]
MTERLYRSGRDKRIGGVCGGLAEYFHSDAIWVRLIMILLTLYGGIGLLLYAAAWIIIPLHPEDLNYAHSSGQRTRRYEERVQDAGERVQEAAAEAAENAEEGARDPGERQRQTYASASGAETGRRHGHKTVGVILIGLGVLFMLDWVLPGWFDFRYLWPLILIALGIWIIVRRDGR